VTPLPPLAEGWPVLLPGWVWLAGAGPGDPGHLTLHVLNALRQAEAVVHDALVDPRLLDWAAPDAQRIYGGKRAGRPSQRQPEISARLIDLAGQGLRVVRLKGGDPFVFGRGGEEAEALVAAGVPVRILPGVSAGIGGLGAAGIPVTHRDVNQAVTFLTGHDRTGALPEDMDWAAVARGAGVLVIYMGLRTLGRIAERLIAGGRPADDPVAVVTRATMPDQRVLETVLSRAEADVAAAGMTSPAIVCIGRAVDRRRLLGFARQVPGG
jgi:uroporphyrin-III C-methyltransferase